MIETSHFFPYGRPKHNFKKYNFLHCGGYRVILKQEGEYKRVYCGNCGELLQSIEVKK